MIYDQNLIDDYQPTLLEIISSFLDYRYKKFQQEMGISHKIKELINNDFDIKVPTQDRKKTYSV